MKMRLAMLVHRTNDAGVADYWEFAWSRWPDQCRLEERPVQPLAPQIKADQTPMLLISSVANGFPEIYHPLDDAPGISRKFSEIETPSAALEFANTYGLLGLNNVPRMNLNHDARGAEWVIYWLEEAQRLRHLHNLWDLCEKGDSGSLGRMIHRTAASITITFAGGRRVCPVHSGKNTQWLKAWKPEDVFGPAKLFIVEEYKSQMHQMAAPSLLLDSKGRLRPHISPTSLLGAIWLEFGQLASGSRKQAVCEYCGRVMDVTENRRHKRVHSSCSQRARLARYYERHHKEQCGDGKTKTRKR